MKKISKFAFRFGHVGLKRITTGPVAQLDRAAAF